MKNPMKKILVLFAALCLFLCSCGESETAANKSAKKETASKATSSAAEESDTASSEAVSEIEVADGDEDTASSKTASEIEIADGDEDTASVITTIRRTVRTVNPGSDSDTSSAAASETDESTNNGTKEILPAADSYCLSNPQTAGDDASAKALREKIRNAADNVSHTGTVYYISASGKTTNDGKSESTPWNPTAYVLGRFNLKAGDTVLFKRGDIFRLSSGFSLVSGVTYAAYGTGAKPAFYGSLQNYCEDELWEASDRRYIWKLDFQAGEPGIIVFNHGESVGNRVSSMRKISGNGDYYYESTGGIIYLYCDKGYPDMVYKDIEIGFEFTVFSGNNLTNVTIDNLKVLYTGGHAMNFSNCSGMTITNCEIGWCGGAYLNDTGERYGNGIQFWENASDITVKNCWIYQMYDAGLTFQSSNSAAYSNLEFTDNLLEYNVYNFEFFVDYSDETTSYNSIHLNNNIFRLAGYGWGMQRPYSTGCAHITGWFQEAANAKKAPVENCSDFQIQNNIFDCSAKNIVYWGWDNGQTQPGMIISGNTFYQKIADKQYHKEVSTTLANVLHYATYAQMNATNGQEFADAIKLFDATPKKVQWLS